MLLAGLAACSAQRPAAAPASAGSKVDYQARALAWADVVRRASQVEGYAGFERTAETLFIGFTADAAAKLARITARSDVAPFTAQHSYAYVQAQLAAANRAFPAANIPYAALGADYRRGAIVVTDVENANKRGPFRCDQLVPLPTALPGVSLPLIDARECAK